MHEIRRARDAALKDLFDVMATEVAHATEHVLGRSVNARRSGPIDRRSLAQFPRRSVTVFRFFESSRHVRWLNRTPEISRIGSVMEDPSSQAIARTYADALARRGGRDRHRAACSKSWARFVDDVLRKLPGLQEIFFARA